MHLLFNMLRVTYKCEFCFAKSLKQKMGVDFESFYFTFYLYFYNHCGYAEMNL